MATNNGMLVVFSGPSGAGKGSVLRRYFELDSNAYFSVSATTRSPRVGEVDGVHYHFVSRAQFEQLIAEGGVLEYTEYNGNYYGTLKEKVNEQLKQGKNVMLDIEVDGAEQIKKLVPQALLIFLVPPSFEELEKRLRGRGTETEEQIEKRLARARVEITYKDKYDYILVNDDLYATAVELKKIIDGERLRRYRKDTYQ